MKYAAIFLLSLLSFSSLAQYPVSPNAVDEHNRRTGFWTILYDSATKVVTDPDSVVYYRIIRYDQGKPVGKVRDFYKNFNRQWDGYLASTDPDVKIGEANYYFENGQVQYHGFYENNLLSGTLQIYNEKGSLISEGLMRNDTTEGKWTFYFPGGAKSVTVTRRKGLDEGTYTEFYESGPIAEHGQKVKGMKTGLWETFYESGRKARIQEFAMNKKNGQYQHWRDSLDLTDEKGFYENDEKSGDWIYYDDAGKKESEGKFINGQKSGLWREYFPNGQEKAHGSWENGKQTGAWVFFHDNAQISAKGDLENGLYKGLWTMYYSNGNLKREASYVRDSLQGHCIYYAFSGKNEAEGDFHMGKKKGLWTYYDKDGIRTSTDFYQNGKLEGEIVAWYSSNNVKIRQHYHDGLREGKYEEYYENRQLLVAGNYVSGQRDGEWKWYHPNGILQSRYFYVDGKYEGAWVNNFPTGKTESTGTSKAGLEEGHLKFYFSNGTLRKEGNAVLGKYEGLWINYDSATGKKFSSGKYVHDLLDGKWTFYSLNGKKESISYYKMGFWETYANICDSIAETLRLREYDLALAHIGWLERVIHRDWPATSTTNSKPFQLHGDIDYDKGNYAASLEWYQKYAESVKRLEGDSSANYLVALNGIALDKVALGKYGEAFRIYNTLLEAIPKTAKDYPVTVSNKSYAMLQAGQEPEATDMMMSALAELRRQQGDTSLNAMTMLQYIGFFNAHWANHYEQGLKNYQEYLRLLEKSKATETDEYINGWREVAFCYENLLKRPETINAYVKLIQLQDSLDYTNTIPYIEDLIELGSQCTLAGRNDTSRIVYNHVSDILEATHRQNSSLYARALDGIATIDYYDSHYEKAIDGFQKARLLMEHIGETKDIHYTGVLQGLGLAINDSGPNKGKEAATWYQKSVDNASANLGVKSLQYQKLLMSLGNFYRNQKQYARADSLLIRAANLIKKYNPQNEEAFADCIHTLGILYSEQEMYGQAITYFNDALSYFRANKGNSDWTITTTLADLAFAQRYSGQYAAAEKTIREQLGEFERMNRQATTDYYNAQVQLAHVLNDEGFFTEAEKLYLSALQSEGKLSGLQSLNYGYRLNSLGYFYFLLGDFKKSEKYYQQYLAILASPKIPAETELMNAWVRVANLYAQMDQPAKADGLYTKALAAAAEMFGGSSAEFARKARAYGKFCQDQNRKADALQYLTAANQAASNVYGSESLIASFYSLDLARLDLIMGRNAEAEKLLDEARFVTTAHKTDAPADYEQALELVGNFYSSMGRYSEAELTFRELLSYVEVTEGKKIYYAKSLSSAGMSDYTAHQYARADTRLNEALTIFEEELDPANALIIDTHNSLGLVALDELNWDKAISHFKFCIEKQELKKQTKTSSYEAALHNLAIAMTGKGQYAEAEVLFKRVAEIRKLMGPSNLDEEANILDNVAQLYQAWGKYDIADKYWNQVLTALNSYIRQNLQFMSDYEKAKFWQKNKRDFEDYGTFAILAEKQKPSIAGNWYDVQLQTKGILLSSSNKVRKRIYASHDSTQLHVYFDWVQTRELLSREYAVSTSATKSRLADSLERHANQLEKEMSMSAEDLRPDKPVTWKDVQKNLGADEAAIEIVRFHYFDKHLTDSVLYAALILTAETKLAPKIIVIPNGSSLENRNYRLYRNSIIGQLDDTISIKNYWAVIAPAVKGKKKIFIAPDGVYNQINLNTLKDPSGTFLMEDYNFVLVSSTREVLALRERKKRKLTEHATLIGNPKFFMGLKRTTEDGGYVFTTQDRSGIKELPGTKVEIASVAAALKQNGWKVSTFEQLAATEENIKQLPSARVIHLATHGFFNEAGDESWSSEDPMLRSGILLTGAADYMQNKTEIDGQNGILTAYEASNLSLEGTELVVLSACETARGEIQQGEGVYGLQRAFLSAGAESLVMSLWKVDDAATEQLMSLFYNYWISGADKNEALVKAERDLRKIYPHPYYWGAFVMMRN